jgi:hypothetical protein
VKSYIFAGVLISIILLGLAGCGISPIQKNEAPKRITPTVEIILSDLDNPRGIVIAPSGSIYVVEAGTGRYALGPSQWDGKLTKYTDINGDGDYNDNGESERWFSHFPSYNAFSAYATGRDEVSGPADLLLHGDGRLFLSVDDGGLGNDMALYEISSVRTIGRSLASRNNMNGIAFDRSQNKIFAVESGFNTLIEVSFEGEINEIIVFPLLESDQQAVPAGLAVDPRTGEVLVALFSGRVLEFEDDRIEKTTAFVDGDSKIVRVNPLTGQSTDEITGLTTAVDVAMDEFGNIYVVELAATSVELLPLGFDLYDPSAPPVHGAYMRYSGRVTLYPSSGEMPIVLASGLDAPTNITIGNDGSLYISVGQGTPGRPIPGPNGITQIRGEILRITNFLGRNARETEQ